jgi:hypothetical protein
LRATPEIQAATEAAADITERQAYRFPLPPHPIAAEQARIMVKLALTQWNNLDILDNALIVVAEIVANAVKTGDVFHLSLTPQPQAMLIEVWDPSEAAPHPRSPSVDRVDGRGLLLVQACSQDWGWRLEERGGKTVWALISSDPSETTPSPVRR